MSRRRTNPRAIKLHRTYSVEEAARVLGVHKNSVRTWRAQGLRPIDDSRPVLFLGSELRVFLERRRAGRKRPCRPGTVYCFRCREPREPALGMVDWNPSNGRRGNIMALCSVCETPMFRSVSRDDLGAAMPGVKVQIVEGPPRLDGKHSPSQNCDKPKDR